MTRRTLVLSWAITAAAAVATVALHVRFLRLDHEMPWEDAPGHLGVLVRWQHWFQDGWPIVRDAHSPLLYWTTVATNTAWGPSLDAAVWAVALYAGLLAAGLSRVGHLLQGLSACALLPLLALATPQLAVYSRMFLLDLPAVAWLPWVLLAAWSSQGFRRPVPTLGLGVALAGLALTKLQVGIWVVPLLLCCGLLTLLRSPWSLLPLTAAAGAIGLTLQRIRASIGSQHVEDQVLFRRLIDHEIFLGMTALTLIGVAIVLRRRGEATWRRMAPGIWLSLSALTCLALVVTWLTLAAHEIEAHAAQVVGVQHHGLAKNLQALRGDLLWTWIGHTHVWLGLAVACAALEATARLPGLRDKAWVGRLAGQPATGAPLALLLGVLALCAGIGVWVTGTTMPIATRYYLPVWVFLVIAVGLSLCRLRAARWTLAPVLALAASVQVAHTALLPLWPGLQSHLQEFALVADRRGRTQAPVARATRSPVIPVPLSPHTTGAGSVYAQVVTKARATWPPTGRCGNFLYKSALVSEPRSYTQLGGLHGLNHCELAELPESLHESASVTPAAVLLLGLSEEALIDTLASLMERTDTPWEATLEIPLQTGGTAGLYAPVSPP